MAARLEWENGALVAYEVAIANVSKRGDDWVYVARVDGRRIVSPPYESEADCRQDCMAEVRRLLKEAGVDCE